MSRPERGKLYGHDHSCCEDCDTGHAYESELVAYADRLEAELAAMKAERGWAEKFRKAATLLLANSTAHTMGGQYPSDENVAHFRKWHKCYWEAVKFFQDTKKAYLALPTPPKPEAALKDDCEGHATAAEMNACPHCQKADAEAAQQEACEHGCVDGFIKGRIRQPHMNGQHDYYPDKPCPIHGHGKGDR